jgi:hypothetical protein
MSCRDDRRVGAERKEAVQIRTFSRGLARHGMTAAGRCKDACWARFYLTLCHKCFSNSSPVTRQPRSHYSVLGFPIWHIFMPGVVLVIAQSSHQTSSKKKVGSTIAREQSPINMPRTLLSICPPAFSHRIRVASVQNRVMHLVCAPFSVLTWAAYRPGV